MQGKGIIFLTFLIMPVLLLAQEDRTKKKWLQPDKYLFNPYEKEKVSVSEAEYRLYRLIWISGCQRAKILSLYLPL